MSVIDLPLRARRPTLARTEPASVTKHPAVPHEFAPSDTAADAREREAEIEADRQLSIVRNDLHMLVLKADAIARLHGREAQAVFMFECARAELKAMLFPREGS